MTLVETKSTHPFSFNRVAFVRSLFGDHTPRVRKSFFGMLFAPIFSIKFILAIYIIGLLAAALFPAMAAYLERARQASDMENMKQQQIEKQMRDLDSGTYSE